MDYDKIYKLAMFFEKKAQEKKDTLVDGTVIETDSKGNPVNKRPLRGTPNKSEKGRLKGPWDDDNDSNDKESVIETDSKGNPVNKRELGGTPNKSEKDSLKMPWHKEDDED